MVEIRRTVDVVSVGLVALCDEYARDGDVLLAGSGERAPKVVDLVAEIHAAPDGGADTWWAERGFYEEGAAQLDHALLDEETAPQAREAFDLPPDAPVEHR